MNSRREFLRRTGKISIAAASALASSPVGAASPETLRILRWKHFVPAYDSWFNETFVREWGAKNNIEVIVDNVGLGEVAKLAAAEAKAGSGHDLVLYLSPPASLESKLIDHREVFEECESRYGKAIAQAHRGSYNPKTKKYYAVCESYAPTVVTYRRDFWDSVGIDPVDWDSVRKGGSRIKLLHEKPVGISLAAKHNGEHSLRALLYSFGGAIQDESGAAALKSAATLEALHFWSAFYQEAMLPEVTRWDPPANNRFMLAGDGSLTIDTISIVRSAEKTGVEFESSLALAPVPEGPAGRRAPVFGAYTYGIWKFANNIDAAKRFIVDSIGATAAALQASGFQNMPGFPGTIDNLSSSLNSDPTRPDRYTVLNSVPDTMANIGFPGYANAATDEVMASGIVSKMFTGAVTGQSTAEQAMDAAHAEVAAIFEKWRERGML